MKNKYCRLCWNTNGWRKPSGSAREAGSYVDTNGFGHEEWLFNYEWCLEGYKYGFLQPINKHRETFEGMSFDAALYTRFEGKTLLVATIRNVYVPTRDELTHAFSQMTERGWLDQMRQDVIAINGKLAELETTDPALVINVRFRPADAHVYSPMPTVSPTHKISTTNYYQAYDWDDAELPVVTHIPSGETEMRSELVRLRAAQQATIVDPKHVRLQNRLYDWLCQHYGSNNVAYEQEFVDLRVTSLDGQTFYEIKTDSSAKACIRNAIGQLLEYAHYPQGAKAVRLIVVGDAALTKDESAYLVNLRERYQLPLFYATFNWELSALGELL